jgi:hypothetical protein
MSEDAKSEFDRLREEVTALKNEITVQKELAPIRGAAEIEKLRGETTALKNELVLQKEFAALRGQVTLELSYIKWAAGIAGLVLSLAAFFGYRTWQELTESVRRKADQAIDEVSARTYELSRGFALADTSRPREAIPFLEAAYERNHYDEPVVIAFISALEDAEEWDRGIVVINQLRSDPIRFKAFRNGLLYNNVGSLLLSKGLVEPTHVPDAAMMLQLSIDRFGPEDVDRKYPLWNFARYWIAKGDVTKARDYLEKSGWAKSNAFNDIKNDLWFKLLPAPRKGELEKLWVGAGKPKM